MNSPFQAKRPIILTVLCILTFLGCVMGILTNLWEIATFKAEQSVLENGKSMWNVLWIFGIDNKTYIAMNARFGMLESMLNIAGVLLCLIGALMMWKLQKNGLYLYIVGQLIPLFTSFFIWATMNGALAMIIFIVYSIIPTIFIIAYHFSFRQIR